MLELGFWVIQTPISLVDQTYPDPLTEEMVYPFKISRSTLNDLIKLNPIYKDLAEDNVAAHVWIIVEDEISDGDV